MSMFRELSFFLGIKISQLNDGIFIYQTKYVKKVLKIFNMQYCKPICTPMISGFKFRKEDEAKEVYKKTIQVNDWEKVICNCLKTRYDDGYRNGCNISSNTQGKHGPKF